MSYNDLKKKRLLRSERSKTKLVRESNSSVSATERKSNVQELKNIMMTVPHAKNVISNCLTELNDDFASIRT
jgi:hypothetical protein